MIIKTDYDLSSVEKCILLDSKKHITAKNYKVHIPRLMPKIPINSPTETEEDIGVSMLFNDLDVTDTITSLNYIESKSMTDYRSWLFGQIPKMTHIESETEDEYAFSEAGDGYIQDKVVTRKQDNYFNPDENYSEPTLSSNNSQVLTHEALQHTYLVHKVVEPPHMTPHKKTEEHEDHVHPMIKPIKMFNVLYDELNNREIEFGREMIGTFISGDLNDFRITHIPNVIPMEGD